MSYSLQQETVSKLVALAKWQHRTPSQQIDEIVSQETERFYNALNNVQRAQFMAEYTGDNK